MNVAYGTAVTKKDVAVACSKVDHLANTASVKAENIVVRVEAVSARISQAWGGYHDTQVRKSGRPGCKLRRTVASRFADPVPPGKAELATGLERPIRFRVARGFPRERVACNLALDLNAVFGLPPPAPATDMTRRI